MPKPNVIAAATAIVALLLSSGTVSSVRAQSAQQREPQGVGPAAANGTAGRIAKFTTATDLGNSLLYENSGRIGLGTPAPTSRLDIREPRMR